MFLYTMMLEEGHPNDLPIGIVDQDNTSTTRSLIRKLEAFQGVHIKARYATVAEARHAIQTDDIYAFLYIPKNMTEDLMANRQPTISYYYSMVPLTSGSFTFKELKTITTLAAAAVGQSVLTAKGATQQQVMTFLQPITLDTHCINNPWVNYNYFLSPWLVAGCILTFVFLLSAYSLGTELKYHRSKELMQMSGNNMFVVIMGKYLPHTVIHTFVLSFFMYYLFHTQGFINQGTLWDVVALVGLTVFASEGFGIFAFGLVPSMRLSMTICSLWSVLSFSLCGAGFPLFAMDSPIITIAQLFPLRHYYQIYHICILNGFPFVNATANIVALMLFVVLPIFLMRRIKMALNEWTYTS